MPLALLHASPDAAGIAELVRSGSPETDHLDYKSEHWKSDEDGKAEAAKDVAAFANGIGGDLILGIEEKHQGPHGFFDDQTLASRSDQQLKDWLRQRLAPRDVAESIEFGPLLSIRDEGGRDHAVRIVTVPPWRHGPVGALVSRPHEDVKRYVFPVRRGRDTRFLTFEQLMRMSEGNHRTIFLRLLEIDTGFPRDSAKLVSIRTPVILDLGGAQFPYRPESGMLRYDAVLEAIDADTLTLKMMPNAGAGHAIPRIHQQMPATVPLDLVQAAWLEKDRDQIRACLAFSGTLVWDGARWSLSLGR